MGRKSRQPYVPDRYMVFVSQPDGFLIATANKVSLVVRYCDPMGKELLTIILPDTSFHDGKGFHLHRLANLLEGMRNGNPNDIREISNEIR